MAIQTRTQRSLLLIFIIAVAVCALVGIYCFIKGRMGSLEERILGTVALTGAATVVALGGAVLLERGRWRALAILAVLLPGVALVVTLPMVWDSWAAPPSFRWLEKPAFTAWVFAIATPHACLVSLPRLGRRSAWVQRATVLAIALLALIITYMIWSDPYYPESELLGRAIGVLSIVAVFGTIAVPILHRVSAIQRTTQGRTVELQIHLTCPRCKSGQELRVGRSRCGRCGLHIAIEIEEELCATCGYSLYRLESDRCPECGTPIASSHAPT